jgi:hypothetical protein
VVIHAPLRALVSEDVGCEIEGTGGVAHPQTVRRLLCTARVQAMVQDSGGTPVALGRVLRDPPAWMVRQLRHRDSECVFPGCGTGRFAQPHHVRAWEHGGPTDLENLVLLCSRHHRLVHEHGWRLHRHPEGTVAWFRPNGTRYRAGPAPPRPQMPEEPVLVPG